MNNAFIVKAKGVTHGKCNSLQKSLHSKKLRCTFEDGVTTILKMGRAEILTAIWYNPPKEHFSRKKIMYLYPAEVRHDDNIYTIEIICRLRNCNVKVITIDEKFFDSLVEYCTANFPFF